MRVTTRGTCAYTIIRVSSVGYYSRSDGQRRDQPERRSTETCDTTTVCARARVYVYAVKFILYGKRRNRRRACMRVCVCARGRVVRFDPHDCVRLVRGGVSAAAANIPARDSHGGGREPYADSTPPPARHPADGRSQPRYPAARRYRCTRRWGRGSPCCTRPYRTSRTAVL